MKTFPLLNLSYLSMTLDDNVVINAKTDVDISFRLKQIGKLHCTSLLFFRNRFKHISSICNFDTCINNDTIRALNLYHFSTENIKLETYAFTKL